MTYTRRPNSQGELTSTAALAIDRSPPKLKSSKIALISRDYMESGGNSDFSDCLHAVLSYCDYRECDTVLFSLFTILKHNMDKISREFEKLKHIRSVFIEEFKFENGERQIGDYFVCYYENKCWKKYSFNQKFGTLTHNTNTINNVIKPFMEEVRVKRNMGDLTFLLCGETNIVKYNPETNAVFDSYGLLNVIPPETKIILNPIHDRMTRFEMKLKRAFLSQNERLVLSVWNKGKTDRNGVCRDGQNPPWTVYANGEEFTLIREDIKNFGFPQKILEIGILDTAQVF